MRVFLFRIFSSLFHIIFFLFKKKKIAGIHENFCEMTWFYIRCIFLSQMNYIFLNCCALSLKPNGFCESGQGFDCELWAYLRDQLVFKVSDKENNFAHTDCKSMFFAFVDFRKFSAKRTIIVLVVIQLKRKTYNFQFCCKRRSDPIQLRKKFQLTFIKMQVLSLHIK